MFSKNSVLPQTQRDVFTFRFALAAVAHHNRVVGSFAHTGGVWDTMESMMTSREKNMGSSKCEGALAALAELQEGNKRFMADIRSPQVRPADVSGGQKPVAIILGCSDSRVPAEIVFDQGLGDLFVIRVAGNIVAPSQVGSVEFAASQFGTRLVVVMGHSSCGAIIATIDAIRKPASEQSENVHSIVSRIRPCVEELVAGDHADEDMLVQSAVRANIRQSANHLRHGSRLLEDLTANDGLVIVGAEYSLDTGHVDFFDVPG